MPAKPHITPPPALTVRVRHMSGARGCVGVGAIRCCAVSGRPGHQLQPARRQVEAAPYHPRPRSSRFRRCCCAQLLHCLALALAEPVADESSWLLWLLPNGCHRGAAAMCHAASLPQPSLGPTRAALLRCCCSVRCACSSVLHRAVHQAVGARARQEPLLKGAAAMLAPAAHSGAWVTQVVAAAAARLQASREVRNQSRLPPPPSPLSPSTKKRCRPLWSAAAQAQSNPTPHTSRAARALEASTHACMPWLPH